MGEQRSVDRKEMEYVGEDLIQLAQDTDEHGEEVLGPIKGTECRD
jgi:hypothetical protein